MSLVRSNQKKQAGFVKEKNRVCVALSRARHGMYVIGDLEMMSGKNHVAMAKALPALLIILHTSKPILFSN